MTSWFAIASAEIRTRRILREKAGCKQSNNYSRTSANGHLYTTATLFCPGRQSIHWLLFKPLHNGHLLLSPRWPLWRGSTELGFISLMPSPPFFPRTPRSAGSAQGYTQYEWTSPGSKPSSPFIALEKKKEALTERSKPRPGTAEAEIEGTFIVFFWMIIPLFLS